MSGYTLGSAKVTFGKIRRKIKAFDGSADGTAAVAPATPKKAASAAPKTPKSSAKRGAATNTGEDGSPTKKSKATPKGRGKKKVVKAEEDAMDNEDDVGLKRKVERYVKEEVVDEDEELEDENGGSQSLFGDGAV
ncbi:hypothetical protein GQ43DRAFT_439644 [Delitschia confertaspora ATCC 74209]|uniref:Uncharacterized protein n=1 Tax=Delitschia confertaspora ATCC 74209 TaxID=1513339 RepID=A0A9P4JNF5_9PLEO|nr:hypothetical protein GQ43DRAFT_439644 [Delitschia confertaspora ATCC 74209]